MVVGELAAILANCTAPRKLQSLAAPLQTDTAASDPPVGSSMRSTVIEVATVGTMAGVALCACKTTRSRSPFSFCGSCRTANGASAEPRLTSAISPVIEVAIA